MIEQDKQTKEKPEENFYRGVHPLSYWRYPIEDLPDMIRAVRDDLWPPSGSSTGDEAQRRDKPR